jgi:formylglycine-generating enzyme required for sulfatase activity
MRPGPTVPQIFVSYRREDSTDVTGRIYDRLVAQFGQAAVFKDVNSIPAGEDFRAVITGAVSGCKIVLVIIGKRWLEVLDQDGRRRLDQENDFVRIEVESALKHGCRVLPVLVQGTSMPKPRELPRSLEPLAYRTAIPVRSDPDFHRDMEPLLHRLHELLREPAPHVPAQPVQAPPKKPPEPPRAIVNSLGMKLVLVPRGTFWMGDRGSQRQVEIARDFYIGVYPVTQEQWQAVMGSNPSYFSRSGGGAAKVKGISDADLKQFPVEQVSWDDVQEFLKRLNAREEGMLPSRSAAAIIGQDSLKPAIIAQQFNLQKAVLNAVLGGRVIMELLNARDKETGLLYRLPTEAEWEHACRGGATSQEDCAFNFYFSQPTNDLSSEQANFDGSYHAGSAPKGKYLERTSKVGSYSPNRLGIYDMHGNVWEWCEDLFEAGGSARVIRGGSWRSLATDCRASIRLRRAPSSRDLSVRLAAVPAGE